MKKLYIYTVAAVITVGGAVLAQQSTNHARVIEAPPSVQTITTPVDYQAPAVDPVTETTPDTTPQTNTGDTTPVTNANNTPAPADPTPTPVHNPVHPDVAAPGTFTFSDGADTPQP